MTQPTVRGQAARIIAKFGGAPRVAELLHTHRSNVTRWTYPAEKGGTGGRVPPKRLEKLLEMADVLGIEISFEDLIA